MREERYTISEDLGNWNIRWHGAYPTIREAQERCDALVRDGDLIGPLTINKVEVEKEVKVKQEFEIKLGALKLF